MQELLTLDDAERLAEAALPPDAWGYVAGGAGDERTLRWNREAFSRYRLRYRVLVDVSDVSTATTVLGTPVSMPVLVAPMAYQALAHEDHELGMARGAAAAGTVMCLSTVATATPAAVAEAAGGAPLWLQLYVFRDRDVSDDVISAALESGFSALVLTADLLPHDHPHHACPAPPAPPAPREPDERSAGEPSRNPPATTSDVPTTAAGDADADPDSEPDTVDLHTGTGTGPGPGSDTAIAIVGPHPVHEADVSTLVAGLQAGDPIGVEAVRWIQPIAAAVAFTEAAKEPDVRPWVLYALGLSQVALGRYADAAAVWDDRVIPGDCVETLGRRHLVEADHTEASDSHRCVLGWSTGRPWLRCRCTRRRCGGPRVLSWLRRREPDVLLLNPAGSPAELGVVEGHLDPFVTHLEDDEAAASRQRA